MVDRPNTTPIGQDRETMTFKALLYIDIAVHVQVCRLFCLVYIPLFSFVQLGYPIMTNIVAVKQTIRFDEDPTIMNISVPWPFVIAGFYWKNVKHLWQI